MPRILQSAEPACEMLSRRIEVRVPEMLVGNREAVEAENQEAAASPGAPAGKPEGAAGLEYPKHSDPNPGEKVRQAHRVLNVTRAVNEELLPDGKQVAYRSAAISYTDGARIA
jgi:hypothetical protein